MQGAVEMRSVIYRTIAVVFALIVLGLLFRQLVTLLLAVLLTVIIAIPLAAFAERLRQFGVPRVIGVVTGLLIGVSAIAGVLLLVIPPFVDEVQLFADEVPGIVDDLGRDLEDVTGIDPKDVGDRAGDFLQDYIDEPDRLIGPITQVGISVAGVLGALLLILLVASYIAVNPDPLVRGLLSLFPPPRRGHAQVVMQRMRTAWIGWMQGVAADMLISGVLTYIGLSLVGLDFAVVFAIFTALLVVVPYFGAYISGLPPVLFALTDSPGKALVVLLVYTAIQQIEGNIVIPLVMSRTVRLHPAVIAIGVVLVGQLFGFVGLFLAVPILAMVAILVDEYWVRPMEAAASWRAGPEGAAVPPSYQPTAGPPGPLVAEEDDLAELAAGGESVVGLSDVGERERRSDGD